LSSVTPSGQRPAGRIDLAIADRANVSAMSAWQSTQAELPT
jgi:hypothetical protein